MNPEYPHGTMRALLDSAAVTPQTREALEERLGRPPDLTHFVRFHP